MVFLSLCLKLHYYNYYCYYWDYYSKALTFRFPDVLLVSSLLFPPSPALLVVVLLLLVRFGYTVIGGQRAGGGRALLLFMILIGPAVLHLVVGLLPLAHEAAPRQVGAVGPLDDLGRHVLLLAPQGGGDGLVGHLGGVGRHEALLHLLPQHVQLPTIPEHTLGEGEQDVQAVDAVAAHHGQVHGDQLDGVGLGHAQRVLKSVRKVPQLGEGDELRGGGVELLPDLVEGLEVVLAERVGALLRGHAEVLQDDGDVHVDHDQEGDDDVADEEGDTHGRAATVALGVGARVDEGRVALVGRRGHDGAQQVVPARRRADLEQADHAVAEGLEVEHVVDAVLLLDVGEVGHAEDGVDEHNEEEEEANVEERRHGHH